MNRYEEAIKILKNIGSTFIFRVESLLDCTNTIYHRIVAIDNDLESKIVIYNSNEYLTEQEMNFTHEQIIEKCKYNISEFQYKLLELLN